MTIAGVHDLYKQGGKQLDDLTILKGRSLVIDIASLRTVAFAGDAPTYYRDGAAALGRSCNFKRTLTHFLNVLSLLLGLRAS